MLIGSVSIKVRSFREQGPVIMKLLFGYILLLSISIIAATNQSWEKKLGTIFWKLYFKTFNVLVPPLGYSRLLNVEKDNFKTEIEKEILKTEASLILRKIWENRRNKFMMNLMLHPISG